MKKIAILVLLIVMILSLGACSLIPNQPDGGDDNKPSDGSVTVTFLSDKGAFENGEASVEVKADANGKIVINSVPRHDGYAFVGWFDGSAEFDPSAKYTKSQTFTAKYASGADDKVYEALFDESSTVSIDINMSDAQWKKLNQDYVDFKAKGSKSPIYRLACA